MSELSNQAVTTDFLKATRDIIIENTSAGYGAVALDGITRELHREFPFAKKIRVTGTMVKVDKKINSVNRRELKKFYNRIIQLLGPNYLKMLLIHRLSRKDIIYLEQLGMKFG